MRKILLISIIFGGGLLLAASSAASLSLATAVPPPNPSSSSRPNRDWYIYWIDQTGVRQRTYVEASLPEAALQVFRKQASDALVTCIEHPYYNVCQERYLK